MASNGKSRIDGPIATYVLYVAVQMLVEPKYPCEFDEAYSRLMKIPSMD